MTRAVIFDMDGLLIESEEDWARVRREFVAAHGGTMAEENERAMQGMNTGEWSAYLRDTFALPLSVPEISAVVIERRMAAYREHLVVLPGAMETVRACAERYPCAIASSSPSVLLGFVIAEMKLESFLLATASSDEVAEGKPAPDVYLLACERLGTSPSDCVAFEDSTNGIHAAANAGLRVIAVPNASYPPRADALARAAVVLPSLTAFAPEMLEGQ